MGERVLMQVVSGDEFGPVVYGHWCGWEAPAICARLAERMASRGKDLSYAAARLVQEVLAEAPDGNLSVGIWNADRILTTEDSHGDAGVILIHADKGYAWEPLDGYHRNNWLAGNYGDHRQRIQSAPGAA